MDNVPEENLGTETKRRGQASARSEPSTDKHSQHRMANKQRKKRAHKRKLRRSHTKG
jgi:hypothetical protein